MLNGLYYALGFAIFAALQFGSGLLGNPVLGSSTEWVLPWPPAAVGLIVLLLAGRRFAPAIFLGYFLASACTLHPSSSQSAITKDFHLIEYIAWATILTLQAMHGSWLANCGGFQKKHWTAGGFLKTLVFAGIIPPIVSATLLTTLMLIFERIQAPDISATWQHWWFSNCLSIIIFGGFILSFYHHIGKSETNRPEKPHKYLAHAFSLSILLVSLTTSVWLFQTFSHYENAQDTIHFENLRHKAESALTHELILAGTDRPKAAIEHNLCNLTHAKSLSPEIAFAINDVNAEPFRRICTSAHYQRYLADSKRYVTHYTLDRRNWAINWVSTTAFEASDKQSIFVLLVGILVSFSIATLILNLDTSRERSVFMALSAHHTVNERNQLLRIANETLETQLEAAKKLEHLRDEVSGQNEVLLDAISDGIIGYDEHGNVKFANPAAIKMLGISSFEALKNLGDLHSQFHHTRKDGRAYDKADCPMTITLQNHETYYVVDEIFWRENGTSFPIEYSVTPYQHDHVTNAVLVFRDVTEKLAAERSKKQIQQRFEAVFNQSFQFIGLLTPDGILLEINQSALHRFNLRPEDVIGRPFWDCHWWAHSKELQEKLIDAIDQANQNKFVRFEAQHPSPEGEMMTVDFSLKPLTDEDGKVILLIPEGRDISYIKKIETEHREMLDKLQEVTRMKRNFVSTLTHDLRTRLIAQNRVLDNLQIERAIRGDERLSAIIRGFQQNNRDLLLMVNNLLEAYQLEDDRVQLLPESVSLFELADACCHELEGVINDRHISIENNIPPGFPNIEADALLLKRIFQNLISNAVANIPPESHISLEAADWDEYVDLTVRDNGPGIPDELLPHVFTKYLSGVATRKKIGSGLGLYICKMISELHNGTIRVDNPPEGGAAISVTLPKVRPQE